MSYPKLPLHLPPMFLTLSAALVAGNPFAHLGLPRVIGGILGGFPLGPSVLGLIALDFRLWLLHGFGHQNAWLPTSCWPRNCPLLIIIGYGLSPSPIRQERA